MSEKPLLFNRVAGVFGLFFRWQVKNYRRILHRVQEDIDFSAYESAIDIGCGTGALCKVMQEYGLEVTGLDTAEAMLAIAERKVGKPGTGAPAIRFVHGDVLSGIPFPEKSFDFATAAFVAHGMLPQDRQLLYSEMGRVAKQAVILIDYNERRSLPVDIVERLEGGDYFNFIESVQDELRERFRNVRVRAGGRNSSVYICGNF